MFGDKPWLIIILLLLVVLIAAGTTFLVLSLQQNDGEATEEEVRQAGGIYELGEFTVNVPFQRTSRFVQTSISLQLVG